MTPMDVLVGVGWFGIAVVGVLCTIFGSGPEFYVSYASPGERLFRKPLARRFGGVLYSVWLATAPFVFVALVGEWTMLLWLGVPCFLLGVFILHRCAPDQLRLQVPARTYQRVRGWPPFSKVRTGPWTDLGGIYVGASRFQYDVGLRGIPLGDPMTLGRFPQHAQAEQFASGLISELGLPRVTPPHPLSHINPRS